MRAFAHCEGLELAEPALVPVALEGGRVWHHIGVCTMFPRDEGLKRPTVIVELCHAFVHIRLKGGIAEVACLEDVVVLVQ